MFRECSHFGDQIDVVREFDFFKIDGRRPNQKRNLDAKGHGGRFAITVGRINVIVLSNPFDKPKREDIVRSGIVDDAGRIRLDAWHGGRGKQESQFGSVGRFDPTQIRDENDQTGIGQAGAGGKGNRLIVHIRHGDIKIRQQLTMVML